jgi:hypothetical protein
MSTESTVLISNIITESAVGTFSYGEKKPGAGYNKSNDGVHTIVYSVNAFRGTIKIQATLELYPADADWFDVSTYNFNEDSTIATGITSYTENITGNFVWIRVAHSQQDGTIVSVRYNH